MGNAKLLFEKTMQVTNLLIEIGQLMPQKTDLFLELSNVSLIMGKFCMELAKCGNETNKELQ